MRFIAVYWLGTPIDQLQTQTFPRRLRTRKKTPRFSSNTFINSSFEYVEVSFAARRWFFMRVYKHCKPDNFDFYYCSKQITVAARKAFRERR